jgi:hypothetical protein
MSRPAAWSTRQQSFRQPTVASEPRPTRLAVQFDQPVHVKIGDCSRDERQQAHAPGRGPPDPPVAAGLMTCTQLRTHPQARIGFWVHSPQGHVPLGWLGRDRWLADDADGGMSVRCLGLAPSRRVSRPAASGSSPTSSRARPPAVPSSPRAQTASAPATPSSSRAPDRLSRLLQDLITIVAGLRRHSTGFRSGTSAGHHHPGRPAGLPCLRGPGRVHPGTHRGGVRAVRRRDRAAPPGSGAAGLACRAPDAQVRAVSPASAGCAVRPKTRSHVTSDARLAGWYGGRPRHSLICCWMTSGAGRASTV